MTTINIKIVGIEGDSVLVKYATDASAKNIDEYDAVAYQPKSMGYTTVDEFFDGIKEGLLGVAMLRDKIEKTSNENVDFTAWNGATAEHTVYFSSDTIPSHQLQSLNSSEVIL